jgi:adenylate cyclase class IV
MGGDAPAAGAALNLELKVRTDAAGLALAQQRLVAAGIARRELEQIDTYFAARQGRLKLREINAVGEEPAAELIAYARPSVVGPRWSTYHRLPIAVAQVAALRAALATTIGVAVVVAKRREVGIRERTRVHLDRVEGLGYFVELETVVASEDHRAGAADELAATAAWLGLAVAGPDVIAESYADLLLAAQPPATTRRGANGHERRSGATPDSEGRGGPE